MNPTPHKFTIKSDPHFPQTDATWAILEEKVKKADGIILLAMHAYWLRALRDNSSPTPQHARERFYKLLDRELSHRIRD